MLITEVCQPRPAVRAFNDNKIAQLVVLNLSRFELRVDRGERVLSLLPVISMGSEAARILMMSRRAHILALFERSFYIQCEQGIICVGVASLGKGPLHVLLQSKQDQLPSELSSALAIGVDSRSPLGVENHSAQRIDHADDELRHCFTGKVSSSGLNTLSLKLTRDVLDAVAPAHPEGFGWILNNDCWQSHVESPEAATASLGLLDSSFRKQCVPALLDLSQWLGKSLRSCAQPSFNTVAGLDDCARIDTHRCAAVNLDIPLSLSTLLGTGPGLTPAGDDLLAGVMLFLHRINRADLASSLWKVLEPWLASRTNPVSSAHLRLAAQGQCSEHLLLLLDHVVKENSADNTDMTHKMIADIQSLTNRIGSSSGWDTLAGMTLVLRALKNYP